MLLLYVVHIYDITGHGNIPIGGNIWTLNTSSITCNRSPNLRTQLFYTSVVSDIIVFNANGPAGPKHVGKCNKFVYPKVS
jgi:hypothetical protein